jgi:hypothetical protein
MNLIPIERTQGWYCLYIYCAWWHSQIYWAHAQQTSLLFGPSYVSLLRQKGREIWPCCGFWRVRLLGGLDFSISFTGRSEFEDGLGSGDFVSGYSYHMSVRIRLPDQTMQTKFQSQRPSNVETSVPSTWVQKWSNIRTVSTWVGDRLIGLCSSYLQGNSWTAVGFRCCITSWGIDPMHCTIHALWSPGRPYVCCERTMSGVKHCGRG